MLKNSFIYASDASLYIIGSLALKKLRRNPITFLPSDTRSDELLSNFVV